MRETESQAIGFLRQRLCGAAPVGLDLALSVDESPLEGEGPTDLFRFQASMNGLEQRAYWVAAGETEPNYYPDWGLSAEEMYDIHVGTRFMLVMEVSQAEGERIPADAREWFIRFAARAAPQATVKEVHVRAAFAVDQEIHIVSDLDFGTERAAVIGYHAPPGIYPDVHLSHHVLYRRHLGKIIRREASAERWKADVKPLRRGQAAADRLSIDRLRPGP